MTATATAPHSTAPASGPVLDVRNLSVEYRGHGGRPFRAANDVSFSIDEGTTLALIGESGSGKSTVGKAILRLVPVVEGEVLLAGESVQAARGARLRQMRPRLQAIFQDPHAALDPRMTAWASVLEPLRAQGVRKAEARTRAADVLERVGLTPGTGQRYPHQLSGGQKQRFNIARALVCRPSVIVCDEPVSALDVSLEAEIVNLLREVQAEFGLTYLFITHDISLLPHIADSVAVQYLGRLMEHGPARQVVTSPRHPYTAGLLASVPSVDRSRPATGAGLVRGEIPDPANPPAGCPFHTRCPFVQDRCRDELPKWRPLADGRFVACHFSEELAPELERRAGVTSEAPRAHGTAARCGNASPGAVMTDADLQPDATSEAGGPAPSSTPAHVDSFRHQTNEGDHR